jgi:hypothetical protein
MEKIQFLENGKFIKSSLQKNQTQNTSIFSYGITKSSCAVVIAQRETGFCISVVMEKIGDVLQINRFELTHTADLEDLSIALFDAAIIEIVLKTVEELFAVANVQHSFQIFFRLNAEDAKNLLSFEGLLGNGTQFTTCDGQKTTFSLFAFPEAQQIVMGKVALIQSQVKHELWKAQRSDDYLRTYLQTHQKGTLLPGSQAISQNWDNVLTFPSIH